MDLMTIIQVAVGIFFVWVVLAMITSQIQEWIASILSWRATMLEDSISHMLGSEELRKQFYNHPLIHGLFTNHGKRKPAGIPEDKFALVVFEMMINAGQRGGEIKSTFESLKNGIDTLKSQPAFEQIACSIDTLLLGIEEKADQTVDAVTEARRRMEGWFNNGMERLVGAYKRRVQIMAIIAGILIAVVLNADTIAIINKLWTDPLVRDALVARAAQSVDEADASTTTPDTESNETPDTESTQAPTRQDVTENVQQLEGLSIPLGWSQENIPANANGWLVKICGLLVSGAAAAQGAPFWFDLMRKLLSRAKPAD